MRTYKGLFGWKIICFYIAVTLLAGVASVPVHAQDADADLAKKAQNPIANLISVPFQNNTNFNIGPYNRTQNVLNIQPVVPFFEAAS